MEIISGPEKKEGRRERERELEGARFERDGKIDRRMLEERKEISKTERRRDADVTDYSNAGYAPTLYSENTDRVSSSSSLRFCHTVSLFSFAFRDKKRDSEYYILFAIRDDVLPTYQRDAISVRLFFSTLPHFTLSFSLCLPRTRLFLYLFISQQLFARSKRRCYRSLRFLSDLRLLTLLHE